MSKRRTPIADPLSPADAKSLSHLLDEAIDNYGGKGLSEGSNVDELEQALDPALAKRVRPLR